MIIGPPPRPCPSPLPGSSPRVTLPPGLPLPPVPTGGTVFAGGPEGLSPRIGFGPSRRRRESVR
eukprot:528507-Hanusia_phi.AAC.1